jgi:hypothetical protein
MTPSKLADLLFYIFMYILYTMAVILTTNAVNESSYFNGKPIFNDGRVYKMQEYGEQK